MTCRRAPRATRSRASPSSAWNARERSACANRQRTPGVLQAPQAVLEHGRRHVGRSLDEQGAGAAEREALDARRDHLVEPAGMHLGAGEHVRAAGRRSRSARTPVGDLVRPRREARVDVRAS